MSQEVTYYVGVDNDYDLVFKFDTVNRIKEWEVFLSDYPRKVLISENENIFVNMNRAISGYDLNANNIFTYNSTEFIYDIAVDNNDNTYGIFNNNTVRKVNINGNLVWSVSFANRPEFITYFDNHIYFFNANNLYKYDLAGNEIFNVSHSIGNGARGIVVLNNGDIVIASYFQKTIIFDNNGNFIQENSIPNVESKITYGRSDFYYVKDGNGIVYQYDLNHNLINQIQLSSVDDGFASDVFGNLYEGESNISKYDTSLNFITQYPAAGAWRGHYISVQFLEIPTSPIKLGETNIFDIYKGSTLVDRAYKGGTLFFGDPPSLQADYIFSGSSDNTIRKIDSSGNQVWSFTGHTGQINDLAVDSNEFIYTASDDTTVKKIDSNGNEVWTFANHFLPVYGVSVDSNGNVYAGSDQDTIKKIDSNGNEVWEFTGHSNLVTKLAVDVNDNVYSASFDGTVRKIDSNGNQLWSFTGHTSNLIRDIAVDKDGFVYSCGSDNTVRKIDANGNQVWVFTLENFSTVAVDLNGNVYTGSYTSAIRKLDSNGNELWSFNGHTSTVNSIVIDKEDFIYSASNDNTVKKIDSSGNQVWSFTNHSNSVKAISTNQKLPLT